MQECGLDFETGQCTVTSGGVPLTTDTDMKCVRIRLTNPGPQPVWIGKTGCGITGGYMMDDKSHDVILEYSGLVNTINAYVSGGTTQVISWLAIK